MRTWIAALLLALCVPALADLDPAALGRDYTDRFLAGDVDGIWEKMSPRMKKAMGHERMLGTFSRSIRDQAGEPGKILSEDLSETQGFDVYLQKRRFPSADRPLLIQWAFGPEGSVEGFFIKPEPGEPSTKFEKYETQTVLRLPFDGEWFVFWGGRERKHNYHVDYENQRYAYDFLVKVDGATHVGDPKDLDAYHCFGKAILAPAGGNVVVAIDGLPDQVPGEMDPANAAGNHVVIDHGNEEYSLLAHLKEGSVAVSEGDEVAQGQAIGACGNSGNTTEPHLHYHLQNGRAFGEGHGLPTPFTDLVVNGEPSDRAEPVGGDTVSPRQP